MFSIQHALCQPMVLLPLWCQTNEIQMKQTEFPLPLKANQDNVDSQHCVVSWEESRAQSNRLGFALTHHRALFWLRHTSSLLHMVPRPCSHPRCVRTEMKLSFQPHLERQHSLKIAGCFLLPRKSWITYGCALGQWKWYQKLIWPGKLHPSCRNQGHVLWL